jgi:hypothetical protein
MLLSLVCFEAAPSHHGGRNQMAVKDNTSAPRGIDEVYQYFLTGRLVEYADAKLSRPAGYWQRGRTCDQQNRDDCAISTQSFGQFQAGHIRHVMVQD